MAETFAARQAGVREAIAHTARSHNRQADAVRLIAVSKTWGAEVLAEAVRAGQKDFGENRLSELREKFSLSDGSLTKLLTAAERNDLVVHFVGSLQSKKAHAVVRLCDWLHTLDRPSLAEALAKEQQQGVTLPKLLVQVNTGEEPQKGGVAPADLAAFLTFCKTRQLNISGLMCLPPHGQPAAPHFAWLRQAAQEHGLTELSCGMSQDWQEAVALGATCVRLGTALFGERQTGGRETGGRETSEQQTGEREIGKRRLGATN